MYCSRFAGPTFLPAGKGTGTSAICIVNTFSSLTHYTAISFSSRFFSRLSIISQSIYTLEILQPFCHRSFPRTILMFFFSTKPPETPSVWNLSLAGVSMRKGDKNRNIALIDHFGVVLCLCFKTGLYEKPFKWKWVMLIRKMYMYWMANPEVKGNSKWPIP